MLYKDLLLLLLFLSALIRPFGKNMKVYNELRAGRSTQSGRKCQRCISGTLDEHTNRSFSYPTAQLFLSPTWSTKGGETNNLPYTKRISIGIYKKRDIYSMGSHTKKSVLGGRTTKLTHPSLHYKDSSKNEEKKNWEEEPKSGKRELGKANGKVSHVHRHQTGKELCKEYMGKHVQHLSVEHIKSNGSDERVQGIAEGNLVSGVPMQLQMLEKWKKMETRETREKLQSEVDSYVNLHKDMLLRSKSRIMNIHQKSGKKWKKDEATIDDILYGGFLNIYKPANLYSMKVCERVKTILKDYFKQLSGDKIKLKVGHGGTLDPFAEGVIIIGIQKGTKQLSSFLKCSKKYLALSIFGIETDTLDRQGKIVKKKKVQYGMEEMYKKEVTKGEVTEGEVTKGEVTKGEVTKGEVTKGEVTKGEVTKGEVTEGEVTKGEVTKGEIEKKVKKFIGWINQTPPIYSAKRIKGLRLYEYARKNIPVNIKPSKVYIKNIQYLQEINLPFFDLYIHCSGGTYIRSLIRDFAHSIDNYATLIKLIRIEQNVYSYEDSLHYDDITMDSIKRHFIKI
ncbi:tRNA pseudouridine synthase, putative [Plasmodium ovale curtisi]|uniref:tRNA pseudouridine(55) synthase n=1 Tax=Plasmodium ovale curtisi TaxID=864141 RepID=A0A1A8XAG7_PLAOA|nr:tRNA pseudouridine synthase, putative [Plasmodium ovale curtisi]